MGIIILQGQDVYVVTIYCNVILPMSVLGIP
jgi:hypothetical protein